MIRPSKERLKEIQAATKTPCRWRDDKDFVAWLARADYAVLGNGKAQLGGVVGPNGSEGIVLYMHEAWCAGRREKEGAR